MCKEFYLLPGRHIDRPAHESEDRSPSLVHARLKDMGLLVHVLDSNFMNDVRDIHGTSTLPSYSGTTFECKGVHRQDELGKVRDFHADERD